MNILPRLPKTPSAPRKPAAPPRTAAQAAIKHWPAPALALFALYVFLFAAGIVQVGKGWIEDNPGRVRGKAALIMNTLKLSRDHPIAAQLLALLVGGASLAWYAQSIRRAAERGRMAAEDQLAAAEQGIDDPHDDGDESIEYGTPYDVGDRHRDGPFFQDR